MIMKSFMILSAVQSGMSDLLTNDPYGFIITGVSVLVVFVVLAILYLAYTIIGLIAVRCRKGTPAASQKVDEEVATAIGLAIHKYLEDTVHDKESYIITIRRK